MAFSVPGYPGKVSTLGCEYTSKYIMNQICAVVHTSLSVVVLCVVTLCALAGG
jgi:hypothetical protein